MLQPRLIKEVELSYKEASSMFSYDSITGTITLNNCSWGRDEGASPGYWGNGYLHISYRGRKFAGHRLAWILFYGHWPRFSIDHIDGNTTNNTIENLRDIHQSHNARNAKKPKNNTSGHIGVSWVPRLSKWNAYIKFNYKKKSLGHFSDISEAISARKNAEQELGFHTNHGR